jgi:hypothetical protein
MLLNNLIWKRVNLRGWSITALFICDCNIQLFLKLINRKLQEQVNSFLDEVSVDDRKFQGDTIQILSVKDTLEIPFAISLGWK